MSPTLLDDALRWMDALWDDSIALLRNPDLGSGVYGDQTTRYMVRETSWYALGLLMRRAEGDIARAYRALETVLGYQLDEAGADYHGTFRRSPEEPHPPPSPTVWKDYDPNWRQFIGTTLALVLWRFEGDLPPALVSRIDGAILKAVHGEPEERVVPSYSNVALMKAWLEVYVGRRYGEPELAARGKRLASRVYELFARHGAFSEYNSPTYYGVVLYALGLWCACGVCEELRKLGAAIEEGLWQEVARYYHAGLKNLCGPFDRSYGMDMSCYAAMLGLWLWATLGKDPAPFPDITKPFAHAADLCLAPAVVLLGARLPEDVRAAFLAFRGERAVERIIGEAPRRVATAWLHDNLMIGGQISSGARMIPKQFHPATVHWRTPDGTVGWLRLVYEQERPADAVASPYRLDLTAGAPEVVFEVHAPALQPSATQSDSWLLPGLTVHVDVVCGSFVKCRLGDGLELRYVLPADRPGLALRFEPT